MAHDGRMPALSEWRVTRSESARTKPHNEVEEKYYALEPAAPGPEPHRPASGGSAPERPYRQQSVARKREGGYALGLCLIPNLNQITKASSSFSLRAPKSPAELLESPLG